MFKPYFARQACRAVNTAVRSSTRFTFVPLRPFGVTGSRFKSDDNSNKNDDKDSSKDPVEAATTRAPKGASGQQEGQFARTDKEIVIPYPEDAYQPQQYTVQGRGGIHFKRTLAQFSPEEKVTVVTGGARGLGLVMAQALVASGSDVAIVDLNSMPLPAYNGLISGGLRILKNRRLRLRLRNWRISSVKRIQGWNSM